MTIVKRKSVSEVDILSWLDLSTTLHCFDILESFRFAGALRLAGDGQWRIKISQSSRFNVCRGYESRSGSSRCVDPVLIDVDLSRLDANSGSKTCQCLL